MTLPAYLTFSNIDLAPLDATALAELQALAAEAMGWIPLGPDVYLHHGDAEGEQNVIQVVGGIKDTHLFLVPQPRFRYPLPEYIGHPLS